MTYTYDIYLNFNDTIYDFFDWKKKDKIIHIKKIPFFKIDTNSLKKIVAYKFIIENDLFNYIKDKTETFNKKCDSCALFSDGNNIIAIKFNSNKKSIKKSFLEISEELNILEETNNLDTMVVKFKTTNKEKLIFETRQETERKKFIENELKNMELDKLKYIFLECYGVKEDKINTIIKKFKRDKNNNEISKKLYNFLNLTLSNKNKML